MTKVEEYREVAPRGAVDIILRLGERLRGRRFLHVSSGRFGGGSAELLGRLVPLTADLGIDANWEITGGDPEFYATARAIQLALQGEEHAITDGALDHYVEMNRINAKKLSLEADLVLVHDVQPASLIFDRPAAGKWLWRCHFDCASPQRSVWRFFRPMIERYDGAIFSMPKFIRRLGIPHFVIHPSIDPLSDKNRDLPRREVAALMAALGIPTDWPLLVQIGPFRRVRGRPTRRASPCSPRRAAPRTTTATSTSASCLRMRTSRSTRSSVPPPSCCRSPSATTSR